MISNIPVAGILSPVKTHDEGKERILSTIKVAVRQVQSYYSVCSPEEQLCANVSEVQQLCDSLDKVLFYGLRECQEGYWPFVRNFSHSNTTKYIESLAIAPTQLQCGRAWLCLALNENSLESYFRSFQDNSALVKKHFLSLAILRDEQRMQLLQTLISGLETIPFHLEIEKIALGTGLTFFNSYLYPYMDRSHSGSELSQFEHLTTSSQCSSQDTDGGSIGDETAQRQQSQPNCNLSNKEFERITKYINMDLQEESSENRDLEVVRTRIVRRVKKSPSRSKKDSNQVKSSENKNENRLSKTTTDSGISLESQCSSDSGSPEPNKGMLKKELSFDVQDFQTELSVTFTVPDKESQYSASILQEERGIPEGQEDPVSDRSCLQLNRPPLLAGNDGVDKQQSDDVEEISIYDLCKVHYLSKNSEIRDDIEEDYPSIESDGTMNDDHAEVKAEDPVAKELARLSLLLPEDRHDFRMDNNTLLYLLVAIYELEEEKFFKMFYGYLNIMKGNDQMVLFLLTSQCVYILKPGNENKFVCYDCTKYSNIEFISVNLNYQGFTIVSRNNYKISLFTADEDLTRSILSNMEVAIRRSRPKIPIPGVVTDAMLQIKNMTRYLAMELKCPPCDVSIQHFVLARWEDYDGNHSSFTPAGPRQEGFLMYRKKKKVKNEANDRIPWIQGYFILNGGFLYCMSEENKSVPLFFIQMCVPHCKGCRRIHLPERPYAFEVILANDDSLQLAAADESEASSWQHSFLHVVSLAGQFIDNDTGIPIPCCIIVANDSIIVAKELSLQSVSTLCRASLCDLFAIYFHSSIPNCVLLEFEIAEAGKSLGEWILTFDAEIEKEKFVDILKTRWFEMFQMELNLIPVQEVSLLHKLRTTADAITQQKRKLQLLCNDS